MPATNTKIITGSALIDGNGGAVLKNPAVVIEGARIKSVGEAGKVVGAAIGVFSPGTPNLVRDSADYMLADTDAVEEFVVWLAETLG